MLPSFIAKRCNERLFAFVAVPCHPRQDCRSVATSSKCGTPAMAARKYRNSYQRSTSFSGLQIVSKQPPMFRKQARNAPPQTINMVVDPWSVSPEAIDSLATQFFAASLFPYLGFLYFLGRDEANCPKLANFGFRFLLVFVFATIPAGIYSKLHYHDILANVDWLHGGAESLLTITNLLIVLGFRKVLAGPAADSSVAQTSRTEGSTPQLKSTFGPTLLLSFGSILSLAAFGAFHAEPWNALSFPTWVIHVSSLVEWLVAMGLVWKYAEVSNNPRWKGLTWGMLPLHTSGICACTYHLFYNAPSLNVLVAIQAALTCFGNFTMAVATYRICQSREETAPAKKVLNEHGDVSLVGFEDLAVKLQRDSNPNFFLKVFAISCVGSALVKWGSLTVDAPFEPSLAVALGIITIPTVLNMSKWAVRSRSESSDFGGFL